MGIVKMAGVLLMLTAGVLLNLHPQSAPGPVTAEDRLSFEVASIKPDHSTVNRMFVKNGGGSFAVMNWTTKRLIEYAFDIKDDQLSGGPSWIENDRFDIDAKIEDSAAHELQRLPIEERTKKVCLMIQSLLADRFSLKISHQAKQLPVYTLVVVKGGPKLAPTKISPPQPGEPPAPPPVIPPSGRDGSITLPSGCYRCVMMGGGQITAGAVPISNLADALSLQPEIGGRVVLDRTGLVGNYDFSLRWSPAFGQPDGASPS